MNITAHHIRARLETMAAPELATFAASLIPGLQLPMLGVRIPALRRLARELAKADWRTVLTTALPPDTFEQVMLRGLIIGYARMDWEERWLLVRQFLPLITNWSLCDTMCATLTDTRRHREQAWPRLLQDLESEEEFTQRFGTVMLMSHFMTPEHITPMLTAFAAMQPRGYYAEMGVAWAVSVCFVKHPDLTLPWLSEHRFGDQVHRLACRKILESLRTPRHMRPVIRALGAQRTASTPHPPKITTPKP